MCLSSDDNKFTRYTTCKWLASKVLNLIVFTDYFMIYCNVSEHVFRGLLVVRFAFGPPAKPKKIILIFLITYLC